jgi:NAD(P)-dependent dehydrogenase (short-subunit alcohol dehydrogenase family)
MTEGPLDGRVVIVTGAGSGIGAGIAIRVATAGARVLLIGRTPATLEQTASTIADSSGVAAIQQCDVSRQEDVDAAVARAMTEWGRIDGLVNNAGIFIVGHCLELARRDWEEIISINLSATFFMSQAAGREMARQGSGAIVNMSSVDGHLAEGTNAPYNTAKAGLLGLTRSLAIDLGPLGIRCNSISPGYVEGTSMAEDTSDSDVSLSELLRNWDRSPSRRMVTIEEVANACLFLLSDDSSGFNGADLLVDGGLTSNLYALESVPDTGWFESQEQALAGVRSSLSASGRRRGVRRLS